MNGIVERFHKTVLEELYRVAYKKNIYAFIEELQANLDEWVRNYNEERPNQGRWCLAKTPMQTFLDAEPFGETENDRRLTITDRLPGPFSFANCPIKYQLLHHTHPDMTAPLVDNGTPLPP